MIFPAGFWFVRQNPKCADKMCIKQRFRLQQENSFQLSLENKVNLSLYVVQNCVVFNLCQPCSAEPKGHVYFAAEKKTRSSIGADRGSGLKPLLALTPSLLVTPPNQSRCYPLGSVTYLWLITSPSDMSPPPLPYTVMAAAKSPLYLFRAATILCLTTLAPWK